MNPQIIAFYLPQFHRTKENDEWWGKGFTEWTNVAMAKPLFRGHYQPKIPTELGFYDLRFSENREAQAILAQKAGISAFCYWHYWFGNGKKLLNMPFEEVVRLKKPDMPFCLAWANHSWYKKSWKTNKSNFELPRGSKLLVEQTYPGIEDIDAHFYYLLDAFRDKRYYKIDGRLLFVIYAPLKMIDWQLFRDRWQELAQKEGLSGFYFVGHTMEQEFIEDIKNAGGILCNLASDEMKSLFDWKRVEKEVRVITPGFQVWKNGKWASVVIYIKMSRGEMTRFVLKNKIENPEELKHFSWEGFEFDESLSDEKKFVFTNGKEI